MKIKMTRHELNECLTNVFNRIINEGKDNRHRKNDNYSKKHKEEIDMDIRIPKTPKKKNKKEWMKDLDAENTLTICEDNYFDDGIYNIEYTTFKTDIDRVETSLLDKIKNNFAPEDVEEDVVDGLISFNVTKGKEQNFIDFLNDNDVNIIE